MLEDATSLMLANSSAAERSRELDGFYTPDDLADQLIACATATFVSVADFAAGAGSLLAAASRKWPRAALYANDLDSVALSEIRRRLPEAHTERFDFLSPDFHSLHALTRSRWELIVLNPPFSRREGSVPRPVGLHAGVRCSRSMAFVLTAVQYLAAGGQLLAILPTSTLASRIDQPARELLQSKYLFEVVRPPAYGLFVGVDVSTYFLRITDCSRRCVQCELAERNLQFWKISRGTVSMARSNRRRTDLGGWVHTTGLHEGTISHRYAFLGTPYGKVAPAGSVLLPRVGRFGPDKIVEVVREQGERISDCIFAIQHPELEAAAIVDLLKENFYQLSCLYSGTGAPYTTVDRLTAFLAEIN